jgi:hypothetical protein
MTIYYAWRAQLTSSCASAGPCPKDLPEKPEKNGKNESHQEKAQARAMTTVQKHDKMSSLLSVA